MTPANGGGDVRAALEEIFHRDMFVDKAPIGDDDELIADLALDSANIAIGLVVIEERFRAVLSHQDVIECETFGDLVRTIEQTLEKTRSR
jgi:acyl carrier protein